MTKQVSLVGVRMHEHNLQKANNAVRHRHFAHFMEASPAAC